MLVDSTIKISSLTLNEKPTTNSNKLKKSEGVYKNKNNFLNNEEWVNFENNQEVKLSDESLRKLNQFLKTLEQRDIKKINKGKENNKITNKISPF